MITGTRYILTAASKEGREGFLCVGYHWDKVHQKWVQQYFVEPGLKLEDERLVRIYISQLHSLMATLRKQHIHITGYMTDHLARRS